MCYHWIRLKKTQWTDRFLPSFCENISWSFVIIWPEPTCLAHLDLRPLKKCLRQSNHETLERPVFVCALSLYRFTHANLHKKMLVVAHVWHPRSVGSYNNIGRWCRNSATHAYVDVVWLSIVPPLVFSYTDYNPIKYLKLYRMVHSTHDASHEITRWIRRLSRSFKAFSTGACNIYSAWW